LSVTHEGIREEEVHASEMDEKEKEYQGLDFKKWITSKRSSGFTVF